MSLRMKLIFSHTAVVFLSLFLTGLALLLLLNRYRDQLLVSELQTRALETGLQVARVLAEEREGNIEAALQRAAERFDVRLILIGEGRTVVWDSQGEGNLEGEPIDLELVSGFARRDPRRVRFGEEDFYLSLLPIPVRRLGGHAIAQVLPARQLPVGTLDLLMRLLGAGVIGFGVAVLLAVWIARSVSRPLAVLTRAAEEMAQGNYDQQIPAEGEDEIGRLAGAFNSMAQAVRSAQRAQRDFLANVSHDLKTPLTSIQGFTQAILDGTLKDPQGYREAARIIQEESIRMGRMVRHLLDLVKREAAPLSGTRRAPLKIESILSDCAASLQPRAQEKGLSLEVDIPSLPELRGDVDSLRKVFTNLLDNAIKYTPAGGRAALSARLSEGAIEVTVRDSGPGIPREELPRIFERFYRGDKSRSRGSGAGLGLAIAKEIVEAHGGRIEVDSVLGQGSEFRVILPLGS